MIINGIEVNLIWLLLIICCFSLTGFGYIVNYCESWLPKILNDTFRYGKASRGQSQLVKKVEVPKYWFYHFYVFASIWTGFMWIIMIDVYFLRRLTPNWILQVNKKNHTIFCM